MLELVMKNGENYNITDNCLTVKAEQVVVGSDIELTYLLFAKSEKDQSIFRLKDIQLVKANGEIFNFNMGFRENTTEWVNDHKKIFNLACSYEKNHKNMSCKDLLNLSKSEEGLNSENEDFSDNTDEVKKIKETNEEITEEVTNNEISTFDEEIFQPSLEDIVGEDTGADEMIEVSFTNCSKDQTLSFPKGIKVREVFDSLFKSMSNPYKDMIVSDKYKFTKWAIVSDDGEIMINTDDEIMLNENTTLKAHWKSLNKKH